MDRIAMVLQESGKISAILDDLRLMVPFLSAYKSHYGAGNASETFAAGAVSATGIFPAFKPMK